MDELSGITSNNLSQSLEGLTENFKLNKNEFLQLLIKELQYQDPLSPMSNQEFTSHLAQLSSLEQLSSINKSLQEGIQVDTYLTQVLNNTLATTLIGKKVKAIGSTINISNGQAESIYFRLNSSAKKVVASIYDSSGNLVKKIEKENVSSGESSIKWDAKDSDGNTVIDGEYRFEVKAYDKDGNSINVTTYLVGIVSGVKYEDGRAILMVGDEKIVFSNVMEILDMGNTVKKVSEDEL